MDEFARIATFFAPLASGQPGAYGLKDDAAALDIPKSHFLVITQDTLVESVHFSAHDPADLVARKALRVNLSDLAAKGAEPLGYLLSLSLPEKNGEQWIAQFAEGLNADQAAFRLDLLGGDSTSNPSGVTITITALGTCPHASPMRLRSGAQAGDILFVSGTIGDSGLGLAAIQGELQLSEPEQVTYVKQRYQLPDPRIGLTPVLRRFATAALDVSDGLLQDLSHLCEASGLKAELESSRIPLSEAAQSHVGNNCEELLRCATAGDDYEILFTVAEADKKAAMAAAAETGIPITPIGHMLPGTSISLLHHGNAISLPKELGYRHTS